MNLDKLKDIARRNELREEWRKAIDAYHRVVEGLAAEGEPVDPALFNRIGDLELKVNDTRGAVAAYQKGAEHYAEQGFFNNAIALCGKILRVDPGEVGTYLRLAELNARKGVILEAKRNLSEYLDRMTANRQQEQAIEALKGFATRFSASYELLLTISALLKEAGTGAHEVHDTLQRLTDTGEHGAGPVAPGQAEREKPRPGATGAKGLVFIDTGIEIPGVPSSTGEYARPDDLVGAEAPAEEVDEISGFEPTAYPGDPGYPGNVVDLDGAYAEPEDDRGTTAESEPYDADQPAGVEIVEEESLSLSLDPRFAEPPVLEPLPLDAVDPEPISLDDSPPPARAAAPAPARAEPPGHAGDAMFDELEVDTGDFFAGSGWSEGASIEELERVLAASEAADDWERALRISAELIACEPDNLARYQKRVELAYRSGDFHRLIAAYLSLADVLMRGGSPDNALLVYERVLDHDPGNPVALAAIAAHAPPAPGRPAGSPAPPSRLGSAEDFVDLGALILDPEPDRDPRMRVEQTQPVGDEDQDFLETLAQFKEGIAANIDSEDFQAHYDLGIAFKEMGLLDEAIAQFQKALRSPEGRLKSSEALGIAFFDKGRFSVAEAVLSRAVEALPGADDAKIGLLYWLGRAKESQGRGEDAVRCYERAMAVDITFLDLSDRVHRLGAGERT